MCWQGQIIILPLCITAIQGWQTKFSGESAMLVTLTTANHFCLWFFVAFEKYNNVVKHLYKAQHSLRTGIRHTKETQEAGAPCLLKTSE